MKARVKRGSTSRGVRRNRLVGFDQRRLELPLRGERASEAVIGVGVVGVAANRVFESLLCLGKETDTPERFAVERERGGVEGCDTRYCAASERASANRV